LSAEMTELTSELDAIKQRCLIKRLLAGYEATSEPSIEQLRKQILANVEAPLSLNSDEKITEVKGLCDTFRSTFEAHIAEMHTAASRSHDTRDKTGEVMASREWWVFENLARISLFPQRFWIESRELLRELRFCNCVVQYSSLARGQRICPACGFSLKHHRDRERLPDKLRSVVHSGLACYGRIIDSRKEELLSLIGEIAKAQNEPEIRDSADSLKVGISGAMPLVDLTENELRILQLVLRRHLTPVHAPMADVGEPISPIITAEEIIEDAVVVNS